MATADPPSPHSQEMYELWGGGAPFTYDAATNSCTDNRGTVVRLFGAIATAWAMVADSPDSCLAIASRCDEPSWGREILGKFKVSNGQTMMEAVGDDGMVQIYKSCKQKHLTAIQEHSVSVRVPTPPSVLIARGPSPFLAAGGALRTGGACRRAMP